MATSGTHAFSLDLTDIMETAFERAGTELRSGWDYRKARREMDLMMLEWQNKGLNLWTVKSTELALVAGTSSYTLTGEKLDIIEGSIRTDSGDVTKQADLNTKRISVSTYAKKTNKLQQGKPTQYWIEQADTGITVHFWPVPDSATPYEFHYYYLERIEDTGAPGSNTMDVPARFLPALTAGLALRVAMVTKGSENRVEALKIDYDTQWTLAADTAREKASWYMRPKMARL